MNPYIVILSLAVCAVAAFIAIWAGSMKWLKIIKADFYFDSLPPGFNGFKILHISDLHSRNPRKMNLNIWEAAVKLDFDIAVMTGDCITGGFNNILSHGETIRGFCEKHRLYYVDGNHEKHCFPQMSAYLKSLGVIALDNETLTLKRNGDTLQLIGLRDWDFLKKRGFLDLSLLLADSNFKIILQHQPQIFDMLDKESESLTLCGHTHGGQVRFPFLPVLFAPRQGILPKYGFGAYKENRAQMLISKGIGATDFPLRFYNRPEIAVITLYSGLQSYN